jgi:hypothetical protein
MTWLTKIITPIKAYLYIGLSLLVSGLMVAVKILSGSNRRLKKAKKQAEARADHAKKVMEADLYIDSEYGSRADEVLREIEKKKHSDELSNPDEW